jgi:hypothetical protein
MIFLENVKIPIGILEILVTNHKTGELIRRDYGHNQIQDWARHALSYLSAGRIFCTWGNHGEAVTDTGSYTIEHYQDGATGDSSGDIITASPWTYASQYAGLIQKRTWQQGDSYESTTTLGDPLYPFFPTKMRFGIGGLDADQNPRTDILTNATQLQNVLTEFPFVLIDRSRSGTDNDHIRLATQNLQVKHKVTFSVKLPGGSTDYPYDGYVISEAGLFCDAALTAPTNDYNMRTGIMWAYRTFYGITKNESIDITFNWTFVF